MSDVPHVAVVRAYTSGDSISALPSGLTSREGRPVSVQRLVMPVSGLESWTVVDDALAVVEPVERFLAHMAA